MILKAPFPYFGGKATVAARVWAALDQPKHYMEPFFGSGAVLLRRPHYDPAWHIETVCDADGYVANAWRSMQFQPDETARWADWPVNHVDLNARRKRLRERREHLIEGLTADPQWCDPELGGYWIWCQSVWIGTGLTRIRARPHLGNAGEGVAAIGQIPHLARAGKGVAAFCATNIRDWFRALSDRLRRVRVVCGDWKRICGGNWQDNMGTCGIFFDPPYDQDKRDRRCYETDAPGISQAVNAWALERGRKKSYRIVLAGYEGEHNNLEAEEWEKISWTTNGGYANRGKGENENQRNERLWFSPHCQREPSLF